MPMIKLYLDTSIISHLVAPDVTDKMIETKQLWEYIKLGKYDLYLSIVSMNDINMCSEPKRTTMLNLINSV